MQKKNHLSCISLLLVFQKFDIIHIDLDLYFQTNGDTKVKLTGIDGTPT